MWFYQNSATAQEATTEHDRYVSLLKNINPTSNVELYLSSVEDSIFQTGKKQKNVNRVGFELYPY